MMDDHAERVRRRAYQIWLDEGRPEGRESVHWDMAAELVAIEDNQKTTTRPVARDPDDPEIAADRGEPVEPAAAMGELPTMTDAGEQTYPPKRDAASETAPAKPAAKRSAATAASKSSAKRSSRTAVPVRRDDVTEAAAGRGAGKSKPGQRGRK